MRKQIYGVGINDADYQVQPLVNGKRKSCEFYQKWYHMLERCYSSQYQRRRPTYIGCTVCDEWLTFSNFKRWMEQQDWEGKDLDKDILVKGNKIYSPETCAFVISLINQFTKDRANDRGDWPVGVCLYGGGPKFQANCSNPFTRKYDFLGYFNSEHEAHEAWRKKKHEHALKLAELQTDPRVSQALCERYQ